MRINIEFDAQAEAAPQAFRDAIQEAANIIDATFTDNITVNVSVGYGELTAVGQTDTLTRGEAATETLDYLTASYSTVRNLLLNSAPSDILAGVQALPATTSLQGHSHVQVWAAEAKALGLLTPTGTELDAATGFATDISSSALVGVALHELTHALGRTSGDSSSEPAIFDFYRYTGVGTHLFGSSLPSAPSYFSLDGGVTDIADYGVDSDPSDLLNNGKAPYDPFEEYYVSGTHQYLTSLDIEQMEALGFHTIIKTTQPPPLHQFSASDVVFRQISTGAWGYMTAHPSGGETWTSVGPSSASYAGLGAGDFNADGQRDVAFLNTTTGDWGFLTPAAGGGAETWHDIGPTSTAYSVVAVADFNNDGATDIAFRNTTTGDLGYMSVDPAGGEIWHPVGATSVAYAPMGAGDFNGDGIMDIAFRNTSTGEWGYMSVNPGGGETWRDVGPTSLSYAPIGVGDFDGQGRAEVAFRNIATGEWGYMSANASGGETWHDVGPSSTAYNAVQVAGFGGDGLSALAFVNPTTGDFGYMEANIGGGETWHPAGPTSTDYFVIA